MGDVARIKRRHAEASRDAVRVVERAARVLGHYEDAERLLDELGVTRKGAHSDWWGDLTVEARIKLLVEKLKG